VSYTLTSVLLTMIAARGVGARTIDFWIPRPSDARFLWAASTGVVRRFMRRG